MKILTPQRKNTTKNLVLLFLTILLVILTALGWINDLNLESIPENSWLGRLYMNLSYGDGGGFELRTGEIPAAFPIEFAVRTKHEMRGVQYNESAVRSFLSIHGTQIGEALSNIDTLEAGSEQIFCQVLNTPGLYLRYSGQLPLSLITSWMGGNYVSSIDPIVRSIFLSADGQLWVRDVDWALYHVDLKITLPQNLLIETGGIGCIFAANQGDTTVLPETLLFEQTLTLPVMISTPPQFDIDSTASLPMLLQAFGYDPYVRNKYDDAGTGKRVFVDRQSTLRLGDDGEVLFRANTVEGGLEAYLESEVAGHDPLTYQVDYARRLLESVFQSFGADAAFYLDRYVIDEQTDGVELQFRYLLGGVPVEGEAGVLAVIAFQNNTLISAQLNLQRFTADITPRTILPTYQAAAAARERAELAVSYFVSDEHQLIPTRYYLKQ